MADNTNTLEVTDPVYVECMRIFNSGLAKIKYEFIRNLEEKDILNQSTLEGLLNIYNQRLVIFQHDFLEYLSRTMGPTKCNVNDYKFTTPEYDKIPEIAAGILAGGGAAVLATVIPVATVGHLWWATSVGAASVVGTALGIGAGAATAGIGLLVGVGIGYGVNQYMKDDRKKEIREKLTKYFDEDITSSLKKWANDRIFEYKR